MSSNHPHGLTPKDLRSIQCSTDGRIVFNAAKSIPYQRQFAVNDVLVIRYVKSGKYVEEAAGIKEKYMVVHKDEADLVYCKRLLKGGKLGQKVEMIATWDLETYMFEPDPERMESILMDQEEGYDPYAAGKALKKAQDRCRRHNKKLSVEIKGVKEADAHLRTIKVGDKIYTAYSLIEEEPNCREVVSVTIEPLATPTRNTWGGTSDLDKELRDAGLTDKCVVKVKHLDHRYKSIDTLSISDVTRSWGYYYHTNKPSTPKDI